MEQVQGRRLATAREAARAAGAIHQQHLHRLRAGLLTIETKQDNPLDLVSEVDRQAQAAAARVIADAFAPTWIVGEEALVEVNADGSIDEHPALGHDAERRWARPDLASYWVIDGLDGTGNYLRGLRPSCGAVAYVEAGHPVACAVYDPSANELFSAAAGQPATVNGEPVRVSMASALEGAVLATETYRHFWSAGLDHWPRQLSLRVLGSPISSLAGVAAGRLDAYVYVDVGTLQRIGPWDIAPGGLLVEQAGGIVTALEGRPLEVWGRTIVAAATPALHAAIVARLPGP